MIQMKTILFQGDSITDCERNRDDSSCLGQGYAVITAEKIAANYPDQYRFLNKGISGNRSVDLYARVKCDIINLKPDILTIMIGVNDSWHELEEQNGVSVERYEELLNMLIEDVKKALPEIKIVLLEPFVMLGSGTEKYYDVFAQEVAQRQAICKRLAEKYDLLFVPLQEKLQSFAANNPTEDVLFDGVHPFYAGHLLICDALYEALKPIL